MSKKNGMIIPELDLTKLDEYITFKQLQAIVYNDEIVKDLEIPDYREYIESDKFMNLLIEFVALNYITKIADQNIKNNIFDVIYYLRYNKKYDSISNKEYLINDLNELICTLNITSEENNIRFYRNQLYGRSDELKTDEQNLKYNKEYIEERKKELNYYIISDSPAISDLIKVDDDQDFADYDVADYLLTHSFIYTSNILFTEMPSIYSNERFKKRVELILKNNILLIKGRKSEYELDENDKIDDHILPETKKLLTKIKRLSR